MLTLHLYELVLILVNGFSLGIVGFLLMLLFLETRYPSSTYRSDNPGCYRLAILLIIGLNALLWVGAWILLGT